MNRFGVRPLFVVALSFVVVQACAPARDGRVRIAIGGENLLIYLPVTLARELGFYREAGVDIELQDHAGGSKALQAMLGGSADVVSGFYDHTIQMAAEGRELVAFVTMLRFPGLVLATSPASPVQRIADLNGRVAGVTSPGSSSHMLLTFFLKRDGVPVDSVSVTGVGGSASAVAAIEHGKVDVAMMTDPAFTIVQRRAPGIRVLSDLRHEAGVRQAFGTSTYPASVLYAPGEWVRGHHETAAHLARAIRRTLEWMHAHSPAEIAARLPPDFRGEDQALFVDALKESMDMYSPDGVMTEEGARAVHRLISESMDKVKEASIDVTKTYTNELISGR